MAPIIGATLISGGFSVLGSLFGRRNQPSSGPSGPDVFSISVIEQQKDNSLIYGIVGISVLMILVIVALVVLKPKK